MPQVLQAFYHIRNRRTYAAHARQARRHAAAYDRQKLLSGLVKACEKRPVSLMQLEQIVDNVEQRVFSALESEVSSKTIGELVMEQLRSVDEVAYVRFASVYRQFKDINTFMDELNTLLKDK